MSCLRCLLPLLAGAALPAQAAAQGHPGPDPRDFLKALQERARQTAEARESAPGPEQLREWLGELGSRDEHARELAVASLVAAGDAALPGLKALLAQQPREAVRLAARRAFSAITGVSLETAGEVDQLLLRFQKEKRPDIAEAASQVLRRGGPAVAYALERLGLRERREPFLSLGLRLRTLQAVRRIAEGQNKGDRGGQALLAQGDAVVEHLHALAADRDLKPEWRAVAAERMLLLGGPAAAGPALDLAGDTLPAVRHLAAGWLARNAPSSEFASVAARLAPAAGHDAVLRADLAAFAERLSEEELRGVLRHPQPAVRAFAAERLGIRRDRGARDALLALLTDAAPQVAASSARALGAIGDDDDRSRLRPLLAHASPRVRRAVLEALGRFGDPADLGWLATALRDPDASVRIRAAELLADAGSAEAVDCLVAALSEEDPAVLAAATRSLATLTGEGLDTVLAVSPETERRRARNAWRRWWDQRRKDAEAGAEDSGEEDAADPAAPLAADGGRILAELASTLQRQFRPYGELKDKHLTRPGALRDAAVGGMQTLLDRKPDPDDPELEVLGVSATVRATLRHFLGHGAFRDARDLGRMLGSLPVDLAARDYILLVHAGGQSMVESLGDRFTRMSLLVDASGQVDPKSLPSFFGRQATTGVLAAPSDSGARVEFVLAMSPADRAGLRRGDRIISINGELAGDLDERQLARQLARPAELNVLRDGWSRPVTFELQPEVPDPKQLVATAVLPGGIGYLRLRQFDLGCAQEFEWALRELERRGIRGLVFDLRGNPGGTVLDAVAVVDKFVPAGEVIATTWTNSPGSEEGHEEKEFKSSDSDNDRSYPLAVLINECSASASEMTTGALQDLDRAVIVGRRSWGKGIGQSGAVIAGFSRPSVFGKSRTAISLGITVLEYFLPSGRSVQGIGIEPDVPVSAVTLLGERFENRRRAEESEALSAYLDGLIAGQPEQARELARYDGWDPGRWPGLDALHARMGGELSLGLLRDAARRTLRARLGTGDPGLLVVDLQEDEDLRAAVTALAEPLGLDLESIDEYYDLAE